jgi:hypothetical protein
MQKGKAAERFPQSMLMISKGVKRFRFNRKSRQAFEIEEVIDLSSIGTCKKRGLNFEGKSTEFIEN